MQDHPGSALIRATLFVRDLDRATRFYRAIGLTETYFEGRLDHPSAMAILGFDDPRPFDIRIVKRPGPNFGMIGLFQLADGIAAEEVPLASGPARIGEVALVFYVANIAATVSELRHLGAIWAPEPSLFTMEHRAQLEVCIRDCDGGSSILSRPTRPSRNAPVPNCLHVERFRTGLSA